MNSHIATRSMVIAVCLLMSGCNEDSSRRSIQSTADESNEQSTDISESSRESADSHSAPSNGTLESQSEKAVRAKEATAGGTGTKASSGNQAQLSIRINLDAPKDSPSIDINRPFRISLTNTSDQPIRIWNPRTKNGYYQLSFQFTNTESGEVHVASKRQIEDEDFWNLLEDEIEPGSETIEIVGNDVFSFQVLFSDFKWGERAWKGLPNPNSRDRFSISPQFESSVVSQKPGRPIWIGKIRNNSVTAKLIASGLKKPHDYLENGFPGRALEIMKADPKWIARIDDFYRTPLHVAARYGHIEVVQWLLDSGADVNAMAYNGFTPLHLTSHRKVIELILAKKPYLSIRRGQEQTPLQDAVANLTGARSAKVKQKWQSIVQLYLDAGTEYDILTAIHLDDFERVKTILRQSPVLAGDFQKESPLRTAASLGRLEICRYLIEQRRVDVNDFERGMGYPIIKEALAHPLVVRLLIEKGADLKTRITWRGFRTGQWIIGEEATLLHYAAAHGVPETVNLLIDNGVDIFATADATFTENNKLTALEAAAFFGKTDNADAILNHPKFDQADRQLRKRLLDKCLLIGANSTQPKLIEALLKKGADPNVKDNGVTAIQRAARGIHPTHEDENRVIRKLISVLVEHGATVDLFSAVAIGDEAQVARLLKQSPESANSRGPDGYPALHFAVGMNYENIVKKLLNAGGDVEIRNKSDHTGEVDETALDCAAFWGRYEMGKLLIDAGADVNALTQSKSTPLHSAARMTNVKVVRLLLENGAKIDAQDTDGETPLDWCRKLNWNGADQIEKMFREYQGKKKK